MILLALLLTSDIRVSLTTVATSTRLADPVRLTLTVEGPAPLRVDDPGLDPESVGVWKLTPDGPAAVDGGRWVRRYTADPFVPGEAVKLGFDRVRVWAGGAAEPAGVAVTPLTLRVTTGVTDASVAAARPTTGPEDLPDEPPAPGLGRGVWDRVVLAVTLVTVVVLITQASRLRRRHPPPPADPLAELDALPDADFAHRLSEVVRGRLHTDALPARRLTTPELPPGPARELLDRLDAVRFGGSPLTAADRAGMLEAVRQVGDTR